MKCSRGYVFDKIKLSEQLYECGSIGLVLDLS